MKSSATVYTALVLAVGLSCSGTSDPQGDGAEDSANAGQSGGETNAGGNAGAGQNDDSPSGGNGNDDGGGSVGGDNTNNMGGDSGGTAGDNQGGDNQGGTPATGGAGGMPSTGMPCRAPRCDDLEGHATGRPPGAPFRNPEISGGGIEVSDERAFSGDKSIKFTMRTANPMQARMQFAADGVLPGNDLFMRAMVWFDDIPVGSTGRNHSHYMRFEGGPQDNQAQTNLNLGMWGSGGQHPGGTNVHVYSGAARTGGFSDCSANGVGRITPQKWICVEMEVHADDDTIQVYYDGKSDGGLQVFQDGLSTGVCVSNPNNNKRSIGQILQAKFGWTVHHPLDGTATMYMDDIAVSDERIGCP